MSGLEVVGLVIALVELGRRIALAVKDAKDLPEAVKDYITNIDNNLDLIEKIAHKLDGPDPFFTTALKQLSEELEQLVHICEEKYQGKQRLGQQVKHFLSGETVESKITAINNKIQLAYIQCLIILHLGTEVHLTSFESKLDLPISALFQGLTSTRDEIRGDMQTIMKTLRRLEQRMEQRMEQHEDAPTLQYHVSENSITTQDISAQGISGTLERKMFDSRFGLLVSALDQEIPLMPFPSDFNRVHDADEESDIILDDALAGCILLLRQLCHLNRKPLDRMRYFLDLRRLVRQLIALRLWKHALELSTKIIPLLQIFRIKFPDEFLLDLIVAHATHALLLGADLQVAEAKSICEKSLILTEQLGKEANAHPIYPLIHRVAAYFVDDIPSRLNYLLKAAQYYKSIPPLSLELYTLPFAETLSSLGRCYLKQQQPLSAIEVLEEAKDVFFGIPSAPPEDLVICFIRLGQAFQATAQLSKANEVLARAQNVLECTNVPHETSLRKQLVRVRQGHNIPSSVSAQTDPPTILSSFFQVEDNIVDNHESVVNSLLFKIDEVTTAGLSPSSDHEPPISDIMSFHSSYFSLVEAQKDQLIDPTDADYAGRPLMPLDDPTPQPLQPPLPNVQAYGS